MVQRFRRAFVLSGINLNKPHKSKEFPGEIEGGAGNSREWNMDRVWMDYI